jgi:phage tail-like protein
MVAVPSQEPEAATRRLEVVEPPEDILAHYLPGLLRQDPFLVRFLRVFDDVLRPIIGQIDAIDAYLDPSLAPEAVVAWLAAWVGEDTREDQDVAVRRALVREAAAIHRMRGTKAGLRRALELITGSEVLITENSEGMRLDEDARLGVNTGLEPVNPGAIHITLRAATDEIDVDSVVEAVERLKPAHCSYSLHITEA